MSSAGTNSIVHVKAENSTRKHTTAVSAEQCYSATSTELIAVAVSAAAVSVQSNGCSRSHYNTAVIASWEGLVDAARAGIMQAATANPADLSLPDEELRASRDRCKRLAAHDRR